MAVAIEDAGFEIRDQIMWVYGSGFPKSHNISKGIDKAAGAEREIIDWVSTPYKIDSGAAEAQYSQLKGTKSMDKYGYRTTPITIPATKSAKQWQGWGTALKPAHEPIVLARKPVEGTVTNNVLTYGVGGINIDSARVISDDWDEKTVLGKYCGTNDGNDSVTNNFGVKEIKSTNTESTLIGRFPANFIHDGSDEVNKSLGEPARFFYCAKANKRDRNEGLDGFVAKRDHDGRADGGVGGDNPRNRTNDAKLNHHPTVKPTDLMQYLCRLITPPNGIILDPFLGSGSTGKAAMYEGFNFIGIELTDEYLPIAKARIEFALANLDEKLF
jgi:site-specific DNA-methyltransferase (adenine-specific)